MVINIKNLRFKVGEKIFADNGYGSTYCGILISATKLKTYEQGSDTKYKLKTYYDILDESTNEMKYSLQNPRKY